jgi:hypothetical protein
VASERAGEGGGAPGRAAASGLARRPASGRARRSAGAALAALLLFAPPALAPRAAEAFVCTRSAKRPFISIWWPTRTIRWGIRSPGARALSFGTAKALVDGAFLAWEAVDCSDVRFDGAGIVPASTTLEELNQVVFVGRDWTAVDGEGPSRDPNALALTTMTFNTFTGQIAYGVIEVNELDPTDPASTGFPFTDYPATGCPMSDTFDLGAVLTHEVGHFLGLAHTDVTETAPEVRPTMTARVAPCDATFRSLETDDVDGLCTLYPFGAPAVQCAPLPEQDTPYVRSLPFGCAASEAGEPGAASTRLAPIGLALAVGLAARARRSRGLAARARRGRRRRSSTSDPCGGSRGSL